MCVSAIDDATAMCDVYISLISTPSKIKTNKKNLTLDMHSESAFWNVIFFFRKMRHSLKNLHGVILPNIA